MSSDSSSSGSFELSTSESSDSSPNDYHTNSESEVETESKAENPNIHRTTSDEQEFGSDEDLISKFYDLDLDPKRTDLSDHDSDDLWATQGYEPITSEASPGDIISVNTELNIREWCYCGVCSRPQ